MTDAFTWTAFSSRVVFAAGAVRRIPDEVARLEKQRALLIGSGASTSKALDRLRDFGKSLGAGFFRHIQDQTQQAIYTCGTLSRRQRFKV